MMYDENEELGDHRSAMIRFTSDLAMGRPIHVHRGSMRSWLHVSDAVRAVEAAAAIDRYAVVNIGHPDVMPIETLAEMIRSTLGADKSLIKVNDLPPRMTLVKRPTLERMQQLLGVTPKVSVQDGVGLVCARVQERLKAGERPS
jgi:nucleoside-diphosphate-sugar epimerase